MTKNLFVAIALAAPVVLAPKLASAASFTFCVDWNVETSGSGAGSVWDGLVEDYWTSDTAAARDAYGLKFRAFRPASGGDPGVNALVYADSETGCGTFEDTSGSHTYTVTAFSESWDNEGNQIVVSDANNDAWEFVHTGVTAAPGTTHMSFGGAGSNDDNMRVNAIGIAAFSARRMNFGIGSKQIFIREGGCSSAHGAGDGCSTIEDLDEGKAHIRLKVADGSDHRNVKWIVSHEMGHAWLLLNHGQVQAEPVSGSYTGFTASGTCSNGTGYTTDSIEFDVVGFREGMADFYAIRVWNDQVLRATYGDKDAEFYGTQASNNPNAAGGRTFNICSQSLTAKCNNNVSTPSDWMRFWWDMHTNYSWSSGTIRNVYERVLDNHNNSSCLLSDDGYYQCAEFAASQLVGTTDFNNFVSTADWNGINGSDNSNCP